MKFIGLILLFNFCYCFNDNATLKLVHVFFRHGSRTPDKHEIYPNDPLTSKNFSALGYGQLTNIGMRRAYQLGKLLRDRYESFLGQNRTPEVVWAQSTDFDRTQMSVLLVMAALFPPHPSEILDYNLNWIPMPYHYEKNNRDYELKRPLSYCPTYARELEKVLESDEVKQILKVHADTFAYATLHTGKVFKNLHDMFYLYQVLHAEESMNYTLPEWTKRIYPQEVHHLAGQQCFYENANIVLKKLNGGRMLKKVVKNMISKADGTLQPPKRKIYLYSGHDNNVANILSSLNLFNPHVPEFSSAVMIELYYLHKTKNYAVKVVYAKDVLLAPEEQIVPGCNTTLCPMDQFLTIVQPVLPKNFTKECESKILLD